MQGAENFVKFDYNEIATIEDDIKEKLYELEECINDLKKVSTFSNDVWSGRAANSYNKSVSNLIKQMEDFNGGATELYNILKEHHRNYKSIDRL